MDNYQQPVLENAYRRMSDASMLSTGSMGSTVSPIGPSTPADSFDGYYVKRESSQDYAMVHGSPSTFESGAYPYSTDLMGQSWHFLASEHSHHDAQEVPLPFGTTDNSSFCSLASDDPFRFSNYPSYAGQILDFTPNLVSNQPLADMMSEGLDAFSPHWSSGNGETKSTVTPSETFRLPEVVTSFDTAPWEFASDPTCNVGGSAYPISRPLPTPPHSPQRFRPQKKTRRHHLEGQQPSRSVKEGRVQKRQPTQSPSAERFICNQPMHERAPDGSVRPTLDKEGNAKICTKTFRRAEHLTRHKKTDGHDGTPSDTFCPLPGCKKSQVAFSGGRRDNLIDHYKKTHCRIPDHKGRNERISREEAARHGEMWLHAWDDAQVDKAKDQLKNIWLPHGGAEQDAHEVIKFFQDNDLRLKPAQLRKMLNCSRLEEHLLGLLPPLDEQRPTKAGKCRSRPRR